MGRPLNMAAFALFAVSAGCSTMPGAAIGEGSESQTAAAQTSKSTGDAATKPADDTGIKENTDAPDANDDTPPASSASCQNTANLRTASITLTVLKNRPSDGGQRCPFGMGDNRPRSAGNYSARLERKVDIAIPVDRKVCGITPTASVQTIRFDDHMFLTLNGNVLVASNGIPGAFTLNSGGFAQYDWSKIAGQQANGSNTRCNNGVTCQVPGSNSNGNFSFSLSADARAKLFKLVEDKPMSFTMVIVGDDDGGQDCLLQDDVTLKLDYTYVPK